MVTVPHPSSLIAAGTGGLTGVQPAVSRSSCGVTKPVRWHQSAGYKTALPSFTLGQGVLQWEKAIDAHAAARRSGAVTEKGAPTRSGKQALSRAQ
jgi:hypothetical protein